MTGSRIDVALLSHPLFGMAKEAIVVNRPKLLAHLVVIQFQFFTIAC